MSNRSSQVYPILHWFCGIAERLFISSPTSIFQILIILGDQNWPLRLIFHFMRYALMSIDSVISQFVDVRINRSLELSVEHQAFKPWIQNPNLCSGPTSIKDFGRRVRCPLVPIYWAKFSLFVLFNKENVRSWAS